MLNLFRKLDRWCYKLIIITVYEQKWNYIQNIVGIISLIILVKSNSFFLIIIESNS